jgi:hypothetical protein
MDTALVKFIIDETIDAHDVNTVYKIAANDGISQLIEWCESEFRPTEENPVTVVIRRVGRKIFFIVEKNDVLVWDSPNKDWLFGDEDLKEEEGWQGAGSGEVWM